MENILLKGMVTATSNKVDSRFKQEAPTKTAYITIADEDIAKAIQFGLTEYSSKQDGNRFFIIKLPQNIAIYVQGGDNVTPEKMSGGIDSPNFMTNKDKMLNLNIIKGENMGNEFFRLQAIQITDSTDIISVEQTNPFA